MPAIYLCSKALMDKEVGYYLRFHLIKNRGAHLSTRKCLLCWTKMASHSGGIR